MHFLQLRFGRWARFKIARYRATYSLLQWNYLRVASRRNKLNVFEPHFAALAPLYTISKQAAACTPGFQVLRFAQKPGSFRKKTTRFAN